ncbi:MAG: glycine C-acetyltransferase [Spirochaetia bacterium]|jgi:glycine C-acetyltransferase|nr:glycine C-acetyltransferase [Spirochaetia bacterium]
MYGEYKNYAKELLKGIKEKGVLKYEREIISRQGREIETSDGRKLLNFCSNNYLGFSGRPDIAKGAHDALDRWGFGLSSVRFICGTQSIHKQLESEIADFTGTEDAILYAACFDANGGVFEPLFDDNDAIISDELNHASIIDGIRLCKAKRLRYNHMDMADLEAKLKESESSRFRIICTDGVFSMDGDLAPLDKICSLAEKYNALVMVDDSHATGYIGKTGRGTAEHFNVIGKIDIITTTFGKALGGASGGCICGRKEIVQMLRQKSRPYLFSNTLPPVIAGGVLTALSILEKTGSSLMESIREKSGYFRKGMKKSGFDIRDGETAIIPVMFYEEKPAAVTAQQLYDKGFYVIPFTYPVVPAGKARIRVQITAEHSYEDIEQLVKAFSEVKKKM